MSRTLRIFAIARRQALPYFLCLLFLIEGIIDKCLCPGKAERLYTSVSYRQLALVSSDCVLDNYESSSATGMFMAPLTYGSLTLTGQGELEMFNTLHSCITETIYGRLVSKSLRLHSRGMTSAFSNVICQWVFHLSCTSGLVWHGNPGITCGSFFRFALTAFCCFHVSGLDELQSSCVCCFRSLKFRLKYLCSNILYCLLYKTFLY